MHQQLWGYKVEEKLYLVVREQKRLNTTGLVYHKHTKFNIKQALNYVHNVKENELQCK
jgi:hypothetical protein